MEQREDEFSSNGYEVLTGKRLRDFKLAYEQYISYLSDVKDMNVPNMPGDATDMDVANISKAPKVGVFSFRAFLNSGMLLTESDRVATTLTPSLPCYSHKSPLRSFDPNCRK